MSYAIFFRVESEIPYTSSGAILYRDGKLSGTVTFTTSAAGVGSFKIVLGD